MEIYVPMRFGWNRKEQKLLCESQPATKIKSTSAINTSASERMREIRASDKRKQTHKNQSLQRFIFI